MNGINIILPRTYVLHASGVVAIVPADATTYYFAERFGSVIDTTYGNVRGLIPLAGTLIAAYVTWWNGAGGTAETSTVSFRLNNTTDTTISSTVNLSTLPHTASNTGLSIAVAQGDNYAIKWVTPTWVTNPTIGGCSAVLFFDVA